MKIMVLSAATGGGHLRAAHAVESYILHNSKGNSVLVVDTLKCIGKLIDHTCCDGYRLMVKRAPKAFGTLYRVTNKETPMKRLMFHWNNSLSEKLIPLMRKEKPDVILSTHPFATEMASCLKETGVLKDVPLICLMTDYGPHQAWIADKVDAYVVSNEDMVPSMARMGVDPEKVYPFGIPVKDVFFEPGDKQKLREKFGLDPDKKTILFMAGSFGVTNVLRIFEEVCTLDLDFQIIVITGKNEKLYHEFEHVVRDSGKPTRLVYFTNEVENYMHASDLLITKPGGLTVSEALACNIPLAVFDAIPGQEEDNANFLMNHHMGVRLDDHTDTAQTIAMLLEDDEELESMREACQRFDKSKSAQNIFMLMQQLYERCHPESVQKKEDTAEVGALS